MAAFDRLWLRTVLRAGLRRLELGAGLGYADPSRGLDMALKVYGLAMHAADDYSEWGVSRSLKLVPGGSGRGLTASLTPTYGVDPDGSGGLWTKRPEASGFVANADAAPSSRLDAELSYGMAVFGGGFTGTPHVGCGLSDTAREYRMGWWLSPAGKLAGGRGPSRRDTPRGRRGRGRGAPHRRRRHRALVDAVRDRHGKVQADAARRGDGALVLKLRDAAYRGRGS